MRRPHLRLLLELLLVILPALFISWDWLRWDETLILPGGEMEWITGSAEVAHDALRETGRLVRWNPYYNLGEPLVENAVSFILNPFSSLPSLLVGVVQGVKWSAAFYMVFTALGGWYCGRVLGLNWVGRVLLAWLLLFKGNQTVMLRSGYFQLAAQQAYFGWIVGAAIELLTTRKRYPLVLTALMIVLMFATGNVWYILPVLIVLGALTLAFSLGSAGIRWRALRRMAAAAGLTLILGAASIGPVVLQQSDIGHHDPETRAGWEIQNPLQVLTLYFEGSFENVTENTVIYDFKYHAYSNGWLFIHYSYVAPWQFAGLLLLGAALVLSARVIALLRTEKSHAARSSVITTRIVRIAVVGLVMIVLMTMWGMGGTDLWLWLYKHVPGLNGWRFVGRALAMGSFWVAVLLAICAHLIWQGVRYRPVRAGLLLGCGLVLANHISYWPYLSMVVYPSTVFDACLQDFRQLYGDGPLTMEMPGYNFVQFFLKNKVRHYNIESDFIMLPQPNTIGRPNDRLRNLPPVFFITYDQIFIESVYTPNTYQPLVNTGVSYIQPCIWYYTQPTLSYAFTLSNRWQQRYSNLPITEWIKLAITTPVTTLYREYDTIALLTTGDPDQAYLVVSENASRGWNVQIDGQPAPLDVIGGAIAVRLPQDGQPHQIVFEFRSQLYTVSAIITLLACGFSILYLLWPQRATPTETSPTQTHP